MPDFSDASLRKLTTCHKDLQAIFNEVVFMQDCTIVEGHRSEERQNELHRTGKSQVVYPNSKHNSYPSMAADVVRYHPDKPHIHWSDLDDFENFAVYVLTTANALYKKGIITHELRWGGDWDRDGVRVDKDSNERFFDGPHFELVSK